MYLRIDLNNEHPTSAFHHLSGPIDLVDRPRRWMALQGVRSSSSRIALPMLSLLERRRSSVLITAARRRRVLYWYSLGHPLALHLFIGTRTFTDTATQNLRPTWTHITVIVALGHHHCTGHCHHSVSSLSFPRHSHSTTTPYRCSLRVRLRFISSGSSTSSSFPNYTRVQEYSTIIMKTSTTIVRFSEDLSDGTASAVSDHHRRGLLVVQRARPEVGLGLARSTSGSMGTASTVKGVNTPDGGGHG